VSIPDISSAWAAAWPDLSACYDRCVQAVKGRFPGVGGGHCPTTGGYYDYFKAQLVFTWDPASGEIEDVIVDLTCTASWSLAPDTDWRNPGPAEPHAVLFTIERGSGVRMAALQPEVLPDPADEQAHDAAIRAYLRRACALLDEQLPDILRVVGEREAQFTERGGGPLACEGHEELLAHQEAMPMTTLPPPWDVVWPELRSCYDSCEAVVKERFPTITSGSGGRTLDDGSFVGLLAFIWEQEIGVDDLTLDLTYRRSSGTAALDTMRFTIIDWNSEMVASLAEEPLPDRSDEAAYTNAIRAYVGRACSLVTEQMPTILRSIGEGEPPWRTRRRTPQ
jgi:hypothetical protein